MFHETDLERSMLAPSDLLTRELSMVERSALDLHPTIPGYVIPYFDIKGLPTTFYRARLSGTTVRYKQPTNTPNAVYFPRKFMETLNGHSYVIMTEGEKKAALADKMGFPTVAFGGVYNWLNRSFKLPESAVITAKKDPAKGLIDIGVATRKTVSIKLNDDFDLDTIFNKFATGFDELVNLINQKKLTVLIVFDSSSEASNSSGVTTKVQRAAARLASELRNLNVTLPRIKQLILPLNGRDKMGIDDFIAQFGADSFQELIDATLKSRKAYPRQPDIVNFVAQKLQNKKAGRKEYHSVALAVITDLDMRGSRLKSTPDGNMYYFDSERKMLLQATSTSGQQGGQMMFDGFRETLYTRYGITGADLPLHRVLSTLYSCEEYIETVKPRRAVFADKDTIYYQINDSEFATVSSEGLKIHDNGSNNVMFQATEQEGLDAKELRDAFANQSHDVPPHKPIEPWWLRTLKDTRLKDDPEHNRSRLATLLFYASPWLFRWRGTQLPIELATGEPGCGKSTLYGLRLNILTGKEDLRNRPQSLKDWHASVLSAGGLHVTDNVNLDGDPNLGQAMSDEMCRMVTEPTPTVEMRKYYTEHDLVRVPVHATFCLTSLRLPFRQTDLIQRAFHIPLERQLDDANAYMFDSDWASTHLRYGGGRVGWVAHHLHVLHRFMQLVETDWVTNYKSKYRLINIEQILMLLAKVFGWDSSWIPDYLSAATRDASVEIDWILQGLKAYHLEQQANHGKNYRAQKFTAQDIADWASMHDEFGSCPPLQSGRKIANYITQHKSLVLATAGIMEPTVSSGRNEYIFVPIK